MAEGERTNDCGRMREKKIKMIAEKIIIIFIIFIYSNGKLENTLRKRNENKLSQFISKRLTLKKIHIVTISVEKSDF